jgi:hypothetical protein
MTGTLHHMSLPAPILRRDFWLYVWRIGLPDRRKTHYVGMTGDTGAGIAQSAMNRVAAHLGRNIRSNALRKYLKTKRDVELEDCLSLDFFAFGPVYPEPARVDYPTIQAKVAALEKHLWARMQSAKYEMLNNQPQATAQFDPDRWSAVCTAFQKPFPDLKPN